MAEVDIVKLQEESKALQNGEGPTSYQFLELDNYDVQVTFVPPGRNVPYEFILVEPTWAMLEQVMHLQELSKSDNPDPSPIFDFLKENLVGGTKALPIRHTVSLFKAIAAYLKEVLASQKNG